MSMLGKPLNKTETVELFRARLGIYMTLAAVSLLLNSIFLAALWKSWKLVKKRRISYHVANLAFCDAFVGASTLVHFSVGDNEAGDVFVISAWTGIVCSLLAVSLMAVERALAIKLPHRWTEILTLKRVFLVMFLNWCCTAVLAVLMHFYDLVMRFILLLLFYVPIMVTCFMYFYIYFKLWKRKEVASSVVVPAQVPAENKIRLYQRKVGSFVLFLTGILVFTVSPSFLTLAVKNACEVFKLECEFHDTITFLSYYFYMLEITNFVVNPIIYVWKMNMYRKAVWQLFGKTSQPVAEYSIPDSKINLAVANVRPSGNLTGDNSSYDNCKVLKI